jgi:serine/threonine protein kinase
MSELKLQQCRLDGRYDILECLGRGSYAEVYLARDATPAPGTPATVVIKALNIFLQGSIDLELERTLIENFRNEAIALDRVRHPNVINRLGHGTAIDMAGQTFHYLVIEYMPGGTMSDLCRHHPLPIESALDYLEQVCAGLAHAHDHGVIHRDIKPQNLLFTADRRVVKIADFGVAKIEAGEGGITRVGTDVYAAPEHHPLLHTGPLDPNVSEQSRVLTPAADVYSLAKTAYMMLTGEAPRRFSQRPLADLPPNVANLPWAPVAARVLRRATEQSPSRRHQTVREFWEELNDALMPKTRLLTQPASDETRTLGEPPGADAQKELPPEPKPATFEQPGRATLNAAAERAAQPATQTPSATRPRIVVPVALTRAEPAAPPAHPEPEAKPSPQPGRGQSPQQQSPKRAAQPQPDAGARGTVFRDHARRWIVVLLLLTGFAVLLLGIHYSIRSRQRTQARTTPPQQQQPPAQQQQQGGLQPGREMFTTTNLNLREGPGRGFARVGEVENGSRVRIVQTNGNWAEVQVLQRGTPRSDEAGADRGWLDGTKLR